jgi:hypothetical protein
MTKQAATTLSLPHLPSGPVIGILLAQDIQFAPFDKPNKLVLPPRLPSVKDYDFQAEALELPWPRQNCHHIALHTVAGFE